MKPIRSILFLSVLIISFVSVKSYSQSFEGEIVMKISDKGQDKPQTIDYYCKGSKIRFEAQGESGQSGIMIIDSKNDNAIIVMPDRKMYMSYPFHNALGAASDTVRSKIEKEVEKGNLKMTGETKSINGFECEKWIFKDDEGKNGEAWMTKGIKNFFLFSNPMKRRSNEPEWERKLIDEGYFPMKVVSKNADGEVESTMEVTSIEPRVLDESLFTPPADYQKMEMPMMPHGN
ncbi:MAG: DUF4412 domain-containing protein [Ignavibacteriaceae bacterium]